MKAAKLTAQVLLLLLILVTAEDGSCVFSHGGEAGGADCGVEVGAHSVLQTKQTRVITSNPEEAKTSLAAKEVLAHTSHVTIIESLQRRGAIAIDAMQSLKRSGSLRGNPECEQIPGSNENLLIEKSITALKADSESSHFIRFPPDCPVAFDLGTNDGTDTEFFLKKGFCVVSVDANPAMIALASKRLSSFDQNKVHFVNMGVDEVTGQLKFYVTDTLINSSMDKDKAYEFDEHAKEIMVPAIRCEALFGLTSKRPYYMKVDIEERHFVCIEALKNIPKRKLPLYISWEMHEYARGKNYPVLDVELITMALRMGYTTMKVMSNRDEVRRRMYNSNVSVEDAGSFSAGMMPEDIPDAVTGSTDWVNVTDVLMRGIGNARAQHGDWWDYYMKLENVAAESPDDAGQSVSAAAADVAEPHPRIQMLEASPLGYMARGVTPRIQMLEASPQDATYKEAKKSLAEKEASIIHLEQVPGQTPGCGFSVDCPLTYSLAGVNLTATLSQANKTNNDKALQALHDAQRADCINAGDMVSTILEHGGWCYDMTTAASVSAVAEQTDMNYQLPAHHVIADEVITSTLAEQVLLKEDGSCCYSLTDLGAGVGQYGHSLKARHPNLEYYGYDGAGNVEEFTQNYVHFVDLTQPLSLKRTDWVMSVEVGEHIPPVYEAQMIANIHAHNCKGVILTWAVLDQGGNGHVNNHSNMYIIKIFTELGYKLNVALTAALRKPRTDPLSKGFRWLEHSAMAFDRITKPASCAK